MRAPRVKLGIALGLAALIGLAWFAWQQTPVQMLLLSRAPLADLQRKVEENPNDWRTQYWYGKRAAEAGDYVRAEPALRAAAGTAPNFLPATTEVGKVLLGQGRIEEAFQILRMVVGRDPSQTDAQLALAQLYRSESAYGKALEILKALRAQEPKSAIVWYELAACQSGLTQYQAAEESLRAALRLEPDNVLALTALSRVRRRVGDLREAESLAREAVRLRPADTSSTLELARVLMQHPQSESHRQEALRLLLQAANLDMSNGDIRLEMGRLLSNEEKWAEAAAELQQAAVLSPSNTEALFLLSRCYRRLGRVSEGRQLENVVRRKQVLRVRAEKLMTDLTASPENAPLRFELAELFATDGQLTRAINQYRSGLQRQPENEKARKRLAELIRRSMERNAGAAATP